MHMVYIRALLCMVLFCLVGSGRGLPIDLIQTMYPHSNHIQTHMVGAGALVVHALFGQGPGGQGRRAAPLSPDPRQGNPFYFIRLRGLHMRVYVDAIVCVSLHTNQLNIPI